MSINEIRITDEETLERASALLPFVSEFREKQADFSTPQGFLATVLNTNLIESIEDKVTPLKNSKYFFIFGIGGSDLSSKAVWQALTKNKLSQHPHVFFIESLENREVEEFQNIFGDIVSKSEIALVVISKSGKTPETLQSFEKIFDMASERFGEPISDRVITIASNGSILSNIATTQNFIFIPWSGNIGGRYSAFTSAHMTVLSLLNVNVNDFLQGGKNAAEIFLNDSPNNSALLLASKIATYYENGCDILDTFLWNEELEDIGLWIRQLVAESLGKENIDGVPVGLTPTVSLGPRDLHSQLELYLGGPKNRFTLFIKSKKEIESTVAEIAYQNTIEAYTKEGLPFEQYEMEEINEKNIAEFFVFMMLTVVYLAEYLKVNAFDQPAVESYKANLNH